MKVKILRKKGGLYTLYTKFEVKNNISETWKFFTNVKNISKIMPKELNFNVTSKTSKQVYEGEIISFRTKIPKIPFLKTNIISEIKKISDEEYFVDQQISGPYKIWYHEHHFKKSKNNTTIITEKINYKLYFHPFSRVLHKLFIRKQLAKLFQYRIKKTEGILNNEE